MELGSRWVNGKELRRGYTTGSCAAAAAKAAVTMLFGGQTPGRIRIDTPRGITLDLPVAKAQFSDTVDFDEVACAVVKDAGDDTDITNGIEIWATVRSLERDGAHDPEIVIKGGQGVGVVTRPGLTVEVGQAAINPGPCKMIREEVAKVLPPGKAVEIIISIPRGEELAAKTFNPRLGIVGGLSVLGTTGIVEPMSEEAWQESLRLELAMLTAQGVRSVILVPGNYGEDFVRGTLGLNRAPLVKISNFVGTVLKTAAVLGIEKVLLVGELGKLIKVSAGIFHTHSRVADARIEIMAAYGACLGADQETVAEILNLNTTGAALTLLEKRGIRGLPETVAERVSEKARRHCDGKLLVGTVVFSAGRGFLALCDTGNKLLEDFRREEAFS